MIEHVESYRFHIRLKKQFFENDSVLDIDCSPRAKPHRSTPRAYKHQTVQQRYSQRRSNTSVLWQLSDVCGVLSRSNIVRFGKRYPIDEEGRLRFTNTARIDAQAHSDHHRIARLLVTAFADRSATRLSNFMVEPGSLSSATRAVSSWIPQEQLLNQDCWRIFLDTFSSQQNSASTWTGFISDVRKSIQ